MNKFKFIVTNILFILLFSPIGYNSSPAPHFTHSDSKLDFAEKRYLKGIKKVEKTYLNDLNKIISWHTKRGDLDKALKTRDKKIKFIENSIVIGIEKKREETKSISHILGAWSYFHDGKKYTRKFTKDGFCTLYSPKGMIWKRPFLIINKNHLRVRQNLEHIFNKDNQTLLIENTYSAKKEF